MTTTRAALPGVLVDHVERRGPSTVAHEIRPSGVPDLPVSPLCGPNMLHRIEDASVALLDDRRVGHLLIAGPEQIMIKALACLRALVAATLWRDARNSASVVAKDRTNL